MRGRSRRRLVGSFLSTSTALSCVCLLSLAACHRQTSSTASVEAATWTVAPRATPLDLLGVDMIDASTGWAVGDIDPRGIGGAVFHTIDGGSHWAPIAGRSEVFTAVRFVTPSTGWIAGYTGHIARTDDGGRTWRDQRAERGREIFNSIWAVDERRAWAVGTSGLILRTSDGGTTWSTVATDVRADLWAVRFISADRGWIAGAAGTVLETRDGGATWTPRRSGVTKTMYGLATIAPSIVIAVGDGGVILRSEDGASWQPAQSSVNDVLYSVAAAPDGTCWAVGANGAVWGSRDSGRTWSQTAARAPHKLMAVALAGSRNGVAVGGRGLVEVLQ